jgi:hypothetical protein
MNSVMKISMVKWNAVHVNMVVMSVEEVDLSEVAVVTVGVAETEVENVVVEVASTGMHAVEEIVVVVSNGEESVIVDRKALAWIVKENPTEQMKTWSVCT